MRRHMGRRELKDFACRFFITKAESAGGLAPLKVPILRCACTSRDNFLLPSHTSSCVMMPTETWIAIDVHCVVFRIQLL